MASDKNGIERSIGRLEGKLDQVIITVGNLKESFDTLEAGRLSALEKEVANIVGKVTMIAAVASGLISLGIFIIEQYISK